jgi:hypothetical protein
MVDVAVKGVSDPDGDPAAITIVAITQDEPTERGPDGEGVGTGAARVRAERAGTGDGRVYEISFAAEDGQGGSCEGAVNVGVPHHLGATPADSGQLYDSTE